MSSNTINYSEASAIPYSSLASLREAHTELLKTYRHGECEQVLAEVDAFVRQAQATGALLDSTSDRTISQSLIDYWVTVLYRAKRMPPDATLAEFDPLLAPTLDDDLCPYVGLNAFQEEHRDTFFGRQALIEQSLRLLETNRLLLVLGPSGSGKSSLVLAGLVPVLKQGSLTGSEAWQYLTRMVPGANPLKNLALSVKPEYGRDPQQLAAVIEQLKKDPSHLIDLLEEVEDTPTLLVVDQFEEIFTLCADDNIRQRFVSALTNVVDVPGSKHTVILTMRTDFENQILKFPDLVRLTEHAQIRVRPLATADLHDAIERPARRVGLRFADGIVENLVRDILGEDAGLPLLQFTLLRLWRMREKNRITWTAYKKLGSARVALSMAADELYNSLIHEDQQAARWIFLRLVRPSELSQEFTSNRVRRELLYREGPAKDRIERVLDRLVNAGLVRLTKGDFPQNDQIEVAHEALVRNWPMLGAWLEDERVNLRQRLRLTSAAEQWKDHGKDAGGLLGGLLLKEALEYTDLTELETEFVRASQAAAEQAERAREMARQRERELEEAKLVAAEEKAEVAARYANKMRRLVSALAIFALIAVATAIIAGIQTVRARGSEKRAVESERVARDSEKRAVASEGVAHAKGKEAAVQAEIARLSLEETKAAQEIAERQKKLAEDKARLAAGLLVKVKDEVTKNSQIEAQLRGIEQHRADKAEADKQLMMAAVKYLREATNASERQDFKEATEKFAQLRAVYGEAGDRRGEADTLKELGRTYAALGNAASAKASYDEALAFYENDLNENAATFMISDYQARQNLNDSIKNLFDIYRERNQHSQMESLLEREMALQEKYLLSSNGTEGNFDYVSKNLAKYYRQERRHSDLEKLHNRVLKTRETVFGVDSFPTYTIHTELAKFYVEQERFKEAEAEYQRALQIVDKVCGPESTSVETVASLKNLASFYRNQRRPDEAIRYYERLVANRKRTKEAPLELANDLTSLADVYFQTGKYQAADLYLQAIAIYEKESTNPEALMASLNSLARLYRDQARSAEAEPLYKQVLNLQEKTKDRVRGKDFDDAVSGLARIYSEQRRYDEQEAVYRQALDVKLKSAGGSSSPNTYASLNELAAFYVEQQKLEEAETYYKQALQMVEKVFGPTSPSKYVIDSLNNLAAVYRNRGLYSQAEIYYKRALENRQSGTKGDSVDLADNLMKLAEVYRLQKKYLEAEPLLRRLIAVQEKAFGPNSSPLANTLELHAKVLRETGRKDQASEVEARVEAIRAKLQDKPKMK